MMPGILAASLTAGHMFFLLKDYSFIVAFFAAIAAAFAAFMTCSLAVHYIPWTLEWLIAMAHKCPECGKRKWSYPFTEGFGL